MLPRYNIFSYTCNNSSSNDEPGIATVLMKAKKETTEETGEENAQETTDLEETIEGTTKKESSILVSSDRYVACV